MHHTLEGGVGGEINKYFFCSVVGGQFLYVIPRGRFSFFFHL